MPLNLKKKRSSNENKNFFNFNKIFLKESSKLKIVLFNTF